MSIPVIIAVKDRPELTRQTVQSALDNTKLDIQLILVDDASTNQDTLDYLDSLAELYDPARVRVVKMPDAKGCGAAKNAGAAIAQDNEYIYFSDNDIYFHEDWLELMIAAMDDNPELGILGGDRHPHHGNEGQANGIIYSDQQVGFSMLLRQEVWREIAPFVHGSLGVYGQEDTDLCNKARAAGYAVGAVSDRVLTHCGITNSHGGQAAGYPEMMAQTVPEGVIKR